MTFLIDEKGKIKKIYSKVKPDDHAAGSFGSIQRVRLASDSSAQPRFSLWPGLRLTFWRAFSSFGRRLSTWHQDADRAEGRASGRVWICESLPFAGSSAASFTKYLR